MSDEKVNREYELYLDERNSLISIQTNQYSEFDKNILLLSSGSFGITFSFITNIIKIIDPEKKWALLLGWVCFSTSILTTLLSLIVSQYSFNMEIGIVDKIYQAKLNGITLNKESTHNKSRNGVIILNISSMSFFILGWICLLVFISISL